MSEFKVGQKIQVIKVKEGLARLKDKGIVLNKYDWRCDRDGERYSLEKRFYDFKVIPQKRKSRN